MCGELQDGSSALTNESALGHGSDAQHARHTHTCIVVSVSLDSPLVVGTD